MISVHVDARIVEFKGRDVLLAVHRGTVKALKRAAAYIYRSARNSIRRTLIKPSQPGRPPHTHRKDADGNIRDAITFKVDEFNMTARIGIAEKLGSKKRLAQIASIHEYGANVQNSKTYYTVGMRGPIRKRTASDPQPKHAHPMAKSLYYFEIGTPQQAELANRVAAEYNKVGMLHYPKRPFMRPTLENENVRRKVLSFFGAEQP